MNPESVEASVVHVAMVGKDVQLNEGERLGNGLGEFKELERVPCVLAVGESTQPHWIHILLTSKTIHYKVLWSRINLATWGHRLGYVLH